MASSLTCTHCGAVLKPKTPVPAGKKIKCPKCEKVFVVAEDEEPQEEEEAEAEDQEEAAEDSNDADEDEAAEDDSDEDEAPAPKKSVPAKSKKKSDDDEEEDEPKKKPAGKSKKKTDDDDDEEEEKPKKKGNTMLILGGGGVLLLCCCGVGVPSAYFGFTSLKTPVAKDVAANKDQNKDKIAKDGPAKTDKAPAGDALKIGADFPKEWKASQEAVKNKFGNKTVEVTGTVARFTSHAFNKKPMVYLSFGPEKDSQEISLIFPLGSQPWAAVGYGQTVTARGKFQKYESFPTMDDAEWVNPPGNNAPVFKAADLAAQALPNPEALANKYKGQKIILVGEVLKLGRAKHVLLLKGKDGRPIECRGGDRIYFDTDYPAGKEVRLLGEVQEIPGEIFNDFKVIFSMRECYPITKAPAK